ncbi:Putative flippase GtrA (transmembrane translocase of bactoprenol-linked glucose) [Filimonas lacunae]|uniref:Putative flippase GtrA (Transmembrane translocase of bactoprenol-linked glucose) n=1 Tax=Filimonas lacunae TaxID=477680 RepID=A0A173MMK9_9BACT|nr:GtrA family protein [Filimonas lacunae]BAV08883.1 membrane protein [Filimonas lacunae]SIS63300.1 Putative flippase GtrA (transmembrane translocase of bactoprenol-linked glucose) [Filimonas lacunae]
MFPGFLWRLIKFGMVGVTGVCIDFGITWLLKEKVKINKFVANTCGFTIAVGNSFVLNRYFTFEKTDNAAWQSDLLRFLGFSLIGLLLNNLLVWYFNEKVQLKFYISKSLAVVIVFFWNFFSNFFFNFKK